MTCIAVSYLFTSQTITVNRVKILLNRTGLNFHPVSHFCCREKIVIIGLDYPQAVLSLLFSPHAQISDAFF